jgi:pimeloyl-ACP methyl ester carboxylesterase
MFSLRKFGVAAAVAAIVFVYLQYRRDIQAAEARIAAGQSQIAQTACGPVEYAMRGDGFAGTLLVIHGAGGGFDQALDLDMGQRLSARGFRVIFVSRFGYLRTPLPADGSVAAQAGAHACLLDTLGVAKASVMGISAGGPSALEFAIRFPERCSALILLVPALPAGEAHPMPRPSRVVEVIRDTILRSDFLFWAAMQVARSSLIETILATPPAVAAGASPGEKARMDRVMSNLLPVSRRRLGLGNDAAVIPGLAPFDLGRVQAPTLAISLDDDLYGTARGAKHTAAGIRGGRYVGYPSGGHLWIGHNDEVFAEVTGFLMR